MRIQINHIRLTFLVFALAINVISFSQKKTLIGINITGERTSSDDFVIGIGGTFETQLTKHSGFETGLYYRNFGVHRAVYINGAVCGYNNVNDHYLSIPVLYKFNSRIINFSIGPSFDINAGWKQSKNDVFPVSGESVSSKINVGLVGKISKAIRLTNKFLLEPEIRYNAIHASDKPAFGISRSYNGIGIAAKYNLARSR